MQVRRILFPTDFSECSQAALHLATSLARDNNAKLIILHVFDLTAFSAEGMVAAHALAAAKESLHEVIPPNPSVEFDYRVIDGSLADVIINTVANDDNEIDLIVMGTHGRSGAARLFLGSVAEGVVRRAPCPVLTLKQKVSAST